MNDAFRGVFANLPSPLSDDGGNVDLSRLDSLVDFLLDHRVDGLACLLSSGEYPYLARDEKESVLTRVIDRAAGRVPVLVGVSELTTRDTLSLARFAEHAGASALIVMPVQYWPLRAEEVVGHFKRVSDVATLPLGIYDNPRLGAAPFSVGMYKRLVDEANVRLSKDSSAVLTKVAAVKEACGDKISILHGNHMEMLPAYLLGASGVCTAMASVFPDMCKELNDLSLVDGNWAAAKARFRELMPLLRFFQENSLARCTKEASEMMGRSLGPQRLPLTGLTPEVRTALHALLVSYGYVKS
jgi:4-hydroxy-tetrahydrodipicolinate synthase